MHLDRTAIVVLNWNCASDSTHCIKSLLVQSYSKLDIIVVDNASTDDSVSILEEYISKQSKSSRIVLLKNHENLGFSGGVNTGIMYAIDKGYEFIGLLNPDAIADKEWCKELVDELSVHPETGLVTGLLLNESGTRIDSSGDFYTSWGLPGPRNRDDNSSEAPVEAGYVFGATGGCVLYRTIVFKAIGLFDQQFFMYYEDIDLSFRAQLAGFKVRYTPNAIAHHKRGASSNKVRGLSTYHTFKNLPMLFLKNMPLRILFRIAARYTLMYSLIFASSVRKGQGIFAFRGYLASITLLPHALGERSQIQKHRKVSSHYIWSVMVHGPLPNQTGLAKFKRIFMPNKK